MTWLIAGLGDDCLKASDCSGVINGGTCKDAICTCGSGFKELSNTICFHRHFINRFYSLNPATKIYYK